MMICKTKIEVKGLKYFWKNFSQINFYLCHQDQYLQQLDQKLTKKKICFISIWLTSFKYKPKLLILYNYLSTHLMQQTQKQIEQTIYQKIIIQQEKTKITYQKIQHVIDKLIAIYQKTAEEIRNGQNTQLSFNKMNDQLLNIKPLTTTNEHFIHCYKKLSKLIKQLDSNQNHDYDSNGKNESVSMRQSKRRKSSQGKSQIQENKTVYKNQKICHNKVYNFFGPYIQDLSQYEKLRPIFRQHYLRKGQWQVAKIFDQSEPELQQMNEEVPALTEQKVSQLYVESFNLKQKILRGDYNDAIKWCENQRLYETYSNLLEYDLRKIYIVQLISLQHYQTAFKLLQCSLSKFYKHKEEEITKLFGHLLFKWQKPMHANIQQNMNKIHQRYSIFNYSESDRKTISQNFILTYYRHHNISQFDTLKIIYQTSEVTREQFAKSINYLTANNQKSNKQLPFSISLPKQQNYHSLFLCPVNKEVYSSNQQNVLYSCGHLVSKSANNSLIGENRNRKKMKCPICQEEIKIEDSMTIEF